MNTNCYPKGLESIQTPFYYYDTDLLRNTLACIKSFEEAYDGFSVHYAIKANANPKLLKIIQEYGLGVDCVSGGEIQASIDAGFAPSKIVYAGVGKSDWEIELGLDHGILCFNVESIPELEVINQIASEKGKQANVCLRINPEVGAHTHTNIATGRAEDKFGISMEDMEKVIQLTQSMSNIHFMGLHFHIGSQILEMADFEALCDRINELQDRLEKQQVKLEIINVGGGLGVDYTSPETNTMANFKDYFTTYHNRLQLREGQTLHFELGRAVVAQCGSLITKTLYVKEGNQQKFVIVDAGFTDLIRPALYQAHHKIVNISSTATETDVYDVVGPICESSDVFDTDVTLPTTKRGDLIAILSAGAYGETMASQYNCRPLAKGYTTEDFKN
jgi:diaminopimelate decarboxylase